MIDAPVLPAGIPAGLPARCWAWLIDLLLRLTLLYVTLVVIIGFGGGLPSASFWLILLIALECLYPVAFEAGSAGATPGKRLAGLAVRMRDGRPLTPAAALTRNLLRAVDFLPAGFGAGIVSTLLRRDCGRLGDLAAGTVVVHVPRPARPGTLAAAADRGAGLCRESWRAVYACCTLAFLPLLALALASVELASWLPPMLLWWGKPWLDRTLLFVLSRAADGVPTRPREVWAARRQLWWRQLLSSTTLRRLSPSRAFTQPVYQLEPLRGAARSRRLRALRAGHAAAGWLLTGAYSTAENALFLALITVALGFTPPGFASQHLLDVLFMDVSTGLALALTILYGVVVFFLEPFYVAAGLCMYRARRAEIEARPGAV